jgi:hypothetical protein
MAWTTTVAVHAPLVNIRPIAHPVVAFNAGIHCASFDIIPIDVCFRVSFLVFCVCVCVSSCCALPVAGLVLLVLTPPQLGLPPALPVPPVDMP